MQKIIITIVLLGFLQVGKLMAQPCLQPSSFVSAFNFKDAKNEYMVFKFIVPYNSKGAVTEYFGDLFMPKNKNHKYYRISFLNIANFCYDKIGKMKTGEGHKLKNFKMETRSGGNVFYVFELDKNVKIINQLSYLKNNFFFVKLVLH
jgi:hypothetical protein